jgi:quercetin dioxygenase-like cupin family protein
MRIPSTGIALFACLAPLLAQQNAPKQEKLVFQNEYVKAYEVTLAPGEKLPAHDTGNRIIYSLADYTLKYQWEGKTSLENRKAGDVHYHPQGQHAEENGGKTPARFILVERLATPLPATEGSGVDMAKANPHNTRVLFDRDMAKVFEVTLYPKDAVSMHFGLHRLMYSFGSGELTVSTPDGKSMKGSVKKGSYTWEAAGLHAVENTGTTPIRFVVFGFKK